jgi:predicted nucleotidyltransferase
MDKEPLIKDKGTALEVIGYMWQALIRHGVTPCHVALFGSFLHGNYHAESDLDMIVISEAFEGKDLDQRIYMTMNAEKEVMKRYLVPMDILLKTPQEYDSQKYFESKIIV